MARLGELEREVMECLWCSDSALTVREVHDQIATAKGLAYTTVMTVLDRLAKKGVARRVRDGRAYRYKPVASRGQLVADLMREALDDAGDGVGRTAALVRFVRQVTPEEAAALRTALGLSAAPESPETSEPPSGSDGHAAGRSVPPEPVAPPREPDD